LYRENLWKHKQSSFDSIICFVATSTCAAWATVTIVLSAILSVFTQFLRFLTYFESSGSQLQFVFSSLVGKSASLASFSPVLDSEWEADRTGWVILMPPPSQAAGRLLQL
jgi:uncharacterized membrane protein YfhO